MHQTAFQPNIDSCR